MEDLASSWELPGNWTGRKNECKTEFKLKNSPARTVSQDYPWHPLPHVSMRVLAALSRGSVIPALPLLTELQLASLNIFPIGKANRKAAERETQRKECLCPPSSILTGKMPQRKLPLLMPFRVQNPGRHSNSTCSWSMSIMVRDFCHFSASNTKSFSIQPQGLIALNSHLKRNTGP